jgi:hypothetical protein
VTNAAESISAAGTSLRQGLGRAVAPKGILPTAEQLATASNPENLVALARRRAGEQALGITSAQEAARSAESLRAQAGAAIAGTERPVAAAIPTATRAEALQAGKAAEEAGAQGAAEAAKNPVATYITDIANSFKETNPKLYQTLTDYGPAISAIAAPLVGMYGAKQATNIAIQQALTKAAPWAAGGLAAGAGFGLLSRGGGRE